MKITVALRAYGELLSVSKPTIDTIIKKAVDELEGK